MKNNFSRKELEEILNKDQVLIELREALGGTTGLNLVGGAVIDILEGRKPKDYDFIYGGYEDILKELLNCKDFEFQHKTLSAITFLFKGEHTIQILSRDTATFKFTIEQSMYYITAGSLTSICLTSFRNKILIPTETNFYTVPKSEFMERVRKWEKKGYTIPDITLRSYKGVLKSWFRKIKGFGNVRYDS